MVSLFIIFNFARVDFIICVRVIIYIYIYIHIYFYFPVSLVFFACVDFAKIYIKLLHHAKAY